MNESGPKLNEQIDKIRSLGVHTIEKDGIKITYEESYEELDSSQQEEMGIKGIRKKIIKEAPADFWENFSKYQELYHLITEGEFPSFSTANHAMWGDGGIDRNHYDGRVAWQKFVKEGGFFQKIRGEDRGDLMKNKYHDVDNVFNLAMLGSGDGCWRDREDCPVFVFGNRNIAFKKYLQEIEGNKEVQNMLRRAGWSFAPMSRDSKVAPEYPERGEYWQKSHFQEKWITRNTPFVYEFKYQEKPELLELDMEILRDKIEKIAQEKNPDEDLLAKIYWALLEDKERAITVLKSKKSLLLIPMYLELGRKEEASKVLLEAIDAGGGSINLHNKDSLKRIKEVLAKEGIERAIEVYYEECEKQSLVKFIVSNAPTFEDVYRRVWPHNFNELKFLAEGIPSTHDFREVTIPAINHPDIRPLRWCYSDLEMVKNDNGQLEILFFETE